MSLICHFSKEFIVFNLSGCSIICTNSLLIGRGLFVNIISSTAIAETTVRYYYWFGYILVPIHL